MSRAICRILWDLIRFQGTVPEKFKNVLIAASRHTAGNIASKIGLRCRPGVLTGRLF